MRFYEMTKRVLVMIVGMIILALGLAICVNADLGISPITTLAYTLTTIFPAISLGTFTFLQHLLFLLLTIFLLRKEFKLWQLLQLPCSLLFGTCIDLWEYVLRDVQPTAYTSRLLLLAVGIVIVGLGFSLIYTSHVALESNTVFLNAVSFRTGLPYGKLKTISDIVIVVIAAVVGLIFLHQIVGIREGTVISALLIGYVAGFFNKKLARLERFFI